MILVMIIHDTPRMFQYQTITNEMDRSPLPLPHPLLPLLVIDAHCASYIIQRELKTALYCYVKCRCIHNLSAQSNQLKPRCGAFNTALIPRSPRARGSFAPNPKLPCLAFSGYRESHAREIRSAREIK